MTEKIYSKNFTAKSPRVNYLTEKIYGISFNPNGKISNSKKLDEKNLTVKSQTAEILLKKVSSKIFWLKSFLTIDLTFKAMWKSPTLRSPTATDR